MKDSVFALIDCNNFFVSCERVFAPKLEKKAVVVLSSNDGCAIARSNEAKDLGIEMGAPFFKFRSSYQQGKIEILSSNFQLYADMSNRVMEAIRSSCSYMEIYSIDEAFLDLKRAGITNHIEFSREVKDKIKQWTGIPVSIGIAPSKTLAKLASNLAKKTSGVYSLLEEIQLQEVLKNTPIESIWGIGKQTSIKLRLLGIGTAKELNDVDLNFIRKNFSVSTEKIVHELRGTSCIDLKAAGHNKTIIASRSFAKDVMEIEKLEEALSNYVSSACVKLRKQLLRATALNISLSTNKFILSRPQYKNEQQLNFTYPTNNTTEIIQYAKIALRQIYQLGFHYHKVGVTLLGLESTAWQQIQIFNSNDYTKSDKLMSTIDKINKSMGRNSVFIAAQGTENTWKNLSQNKSPEYTTNWNELPKVL
jgi:DNA polymerase V